MQGLDLEGLWNRQNAPLSLDALPVTAGSQPSPGNRSGIVCGCPSVLLKTPFVWGGERGVCGAQQRWDSWTGPGGGVACLVQSRPGGAPAEGERGPEAWPWVLPVSWGQGLVLRWGGCYGGRCKRRDVGVLPSGLSSLKEGEHGGPVPREPLVLGGWGKPCHQYPCLRGYSPDFSDSLSEGGKSLSSQEA